MLIKLSSQGNEQKCNSYALFNVRNDFISISSNGFFLFFVLTKVKLLKLGNLRVKIFENSILILVNFKYCILYGNYMNIQAVSVYVACGGNFIEIIVLSLENILSIGNNGLEESIFSKLACSNIKGSFSIISLHLLQTLADLTKSNQFN